MKYYLAIDLGASSGRHVVGYEADGEIVLEEVHRFPTGMDESPDGLVWDIPRFFQEIKTGIEKAFVKYPKIESLAIDTWGVDYVLMDGDKELTPYYAYRNKRNALSAEEVGKTIPFSRLYERTGIQFAPFNSIFQLCADLRDGRLKNATDYLMLPSYFTYKLTGIKTHEYTNESTGAFLNPLKRDYDRNLLKKLSLPNHLFGAISQAGVYVGELLPEIRKEVGGNCPVLLCASHDTASAFESVEIPEDAILLSSGTWSLLGVKLQKPIISRESCQANYTNEGGVGYIRFLKNIMGMYVVNLLRKEVGLSIEEVNSRLPQSTYQRTFDINDQSLSAPESMKEALLLLLKEDPPKNDIDLFASIYHSMAIAYQEAVGELEKIVQKECHSIYVIGGGAKSEYLNRLIEETTKKKVIALPIEATALGNIKIQMKARRKA